MAGTEHTIVTIPPELPLIALKNTVLFPKTVIPLIVQRSKSVNALQAAMDQHRLVLFVTQKNIEDDVDIKDLFTVGTIGRIISVFRLPDGSSKIDVEGITRGRVASFLDQTPYFKVRTEPPILWRKRPLCGGCWSNSRRSPRCVRSRPFCRRSSL